MKKITAVVLLGLFLAVPALGETHTFTLKERLYLNGTPFLPGKYELRVENGHYATITLDGAVVLRALVRIRPLQSDEQAQSIKIKYGKIQVIRLEQSAVVFGS